jgi:hypothetical protein
LSTMRLHHRLQWQLRTISYSAISDRRRPRRVWMGSNVISDHVGGCSESRRETAALYFLSCEPYVGSLFAGQYPSSHPELSRANVSIGSRSHPATSSSTVDKYMTLRDLDHMRTKVLSSCIVLISLLVLGLICTYMYSCCITDAIYSRKNN